MAPSVCAIAIGPGNQRCVRKMQRAHENMKQVRRNAVCSLEGMMKILSTHISACMFFAIIQKFVFLNLWATTQYRSIEE
jgi:hypothetical protein